MVLSYLTRSQASSDNRSWAVTGQLNSPLLRTMAILIPCDIDIEDDDDDDTM